jgi:hypothetical protein
VLFRRFACQLGPEMSQRVSEQPGYVHLGDAQALADLVLREVPVKPEDQDPLLAFGELVQVRVDGFHVDGMLDRLIVLAEQVGDLAGVRPVGQRGVE